MTDAGWPDARLEGLLGSRHPIVCAPMAGAGGVELAVGTILGGAVGSLPGAMLDPETLLDQARQVRARAGGPINLNFFCHKMPEPTDDTAWRALLEPFYVELGVAPSTTAISVRKPFDEAMCAAVEAARPDLASFHFGLPAPSLLERTRATGARILATATSVEEARWLAERGVDGIVAQGWEAGGHNGRFLGAPPETQMGLFALLPQIVDAVDLPVIAAGGIADGRGIAAAFMLGAAAVQIGTAYLRCPESLIGPGHRAGLAGPGADRTAFTNVYSGRLARGLPTRLTEALGAVPGKVPPFPFAAAPLAPLARAAAERGEDGFSPMWAGQSARLAPELPARALTERLAADALALLGGKG
ncbi:NAD(P)H-dependent flavin oxidoreductase [Sphingosinicella terrae]|uniref:NAD(P)H-dependent flavin oxidoreductase n=1 Tax=Sphingosinicella terrae TaxID=2172047 RepID=UPI002547F52F|nr:nitronate monooxygenase [Sphingosinicella terrae]